jgi:hypothetical protein
MFQDISLSKFKNEKVIVHYFNMYVVSKNEHENC